MQISIQRAFRVREILIPPLSLRAYDEQEWRDTLVIVERGSVELETLSGASRPFGRGDVLYLDGVPLRVLHNRGLVPAVLVAISRRPRPNTFPAAGV